MFHDFVGCNIEESQNIPKFVIYSTKFHKGMCGGIDKSKRVLDIMKYSVDDSDFRNKAEVVRNILMLLFQSYLLANGATDSSSFENLSYLPKNLEFSWQKKCLVFISPKSGKGKAQSFWNEIEPAIRANGFVPTVIVTQYRLHARDEITKMPAEELQQYYQVLIHGGDGMVNEVINGFYARFKPGFMDTSYQLRIGALRGGSACAAMSHACARHGLNVKSNINAMWVVTRQQFRKMRIVRAELENMPNAVEPEKINGMVNKKKIVAYEETEQVKANEIQATKFVYSFHSFAVGTTSDFVLNSEKYRCCGESRYIIGP